MDASIVPMKDYAASFASLHNTYRQHIVIVLCIITSSWLCTGRIGIHFGEPLVVCQKRYQYLQWMAKRMLSWKKVLQYAFYMYCGLMQSLYLSLSHELDSQPTMIVCLSSSPSSLSKQPPSNTVIGPPGGCCHANKFYNMLSICIVDRQKACSLVFLMNQACNQQ